MRKPVTSDEGRVTSGESRLTAKQDAALRREIARLAGLYDEQAREMARMSVSLHSFTILANRLGLVCYGLGSALKRCAATSEAAAREKHEALLLWRSVRKEGK